MAGSVISLEGGHIGVGQEALRDPTRPSPHGRRRLLAHEDP